MKPLLWWGFPHFSQAQNERLTNWSLVSPASRAGIRLMMDRERKNGQPQSQRSASILLMSIFSCFCMIQK